jgi:hypothetical protein
MMVARSIDSTARFAATIASTAVPRNAIGAM